MGNGNPPVVTDQSESYSRKSNSSVEENDGVQEIMDGRSNSMQPSEDRNSASVSNTENQSVRGEHEGSRFWICCPEYEHSANDEQVQLIKLGTPKKILPKYHCPKCPSFLTMRAVSRGLRPSTLPKLDLPLTVLGANFCLVQLQLRTRH